MIYDRSPSGRLERPVVKERLKENISCGARSGTDTERKKCGHASKAVGAVDCTWMMMRWPASTDVACHKCYVVKERPACAGRIDDIFPVSSRFFFGTGA